MMRREMIRRVERLENRMGLNGSSRFSLADVILQQRKRRHLQESIRIDRSA
jgi:hypothetical protein